MTADIVSASATATTFLCLSLKITNWTIDVSRAIKSDTQFIAILLVKHFCALASPTISKKVDFFPNRGGGGVKVEREKGWGGVCRKSFPFFDVVKKVRSRTRQRKNPVIHPEVGTDAGFVRPLKFCFEWLWTWQPSGTRVPFKGLLSKPILVSQIAPFYT